MISPIDHMPSLSINDLTALGALVRGLEWEAANGTGNTDSTPVGVVSRLVERGHPPIIAIRVACSGQLAWVHPKALVDDESRPGRDIADGVERAFGQVVELLGREWLGKGGGQ